MLINLLIVLASIFINIYLIKKLIKLKNLKKEEGIIIDFKEKFSKRYVYFIPILKIKEKEIEWKENPKLDKSLLNKKINLLESNNEIFELILIKKIYLYLIITNILFIYAIYNILKIEGML